MSHSYQSFARFRTGPTRLRRVGCKPSEPCTTTRTELLPEFFPVLRASSLPYQLTAPALALLLVFRTEASYSRFEEGRKAWTKVIACEVTIWPCNGFKFFASGAAHIGAMFTAFLSVASYVARTLHFLVTCRVGHSDTPPTLGHASDTWIADTCN
ncbi:hypothetical protein QQ045_018139 [Rhodiola kirilowii]